MIKLSPESRLPHYEDRTFSVTLIVLAVITVLGGGFFYWHNLPPTQDYRGVYAQLGMSPLPETIERQPQFVKQLDQLHREPCYLSAIIDFADALLEAGYPREADTSLLSFTKRCGGSDRILVRRYTALSSASDFSAALLIVDELVKSNPADAQVRYWRGNTYEKLKNFDGALADYINSVQLLAIQSMSR
jgi:tetratricopeptide (TPR) repeat protein